MFNRWIGDLRIHLGEGVNLQYERLRPALMRESWSLQTLLPGHQIVLQEPGWIAWEGARWSWNSGSDYWRLLARGETAAAAAEPVRCTHAPKAIVRAAFEVLPADDRRQLLRVNFSRDAVKAEVAARMGMVYITCDRIAAATYAAFVSDLTGRGHAVDPDNIVRGLYLNAVYGDETWNFEIGLPQVHEEYSSSF